MFLMFLPCTLAGQTGVPPRPSALDYPGHEETRGIAVGAGIVPAAQLAKVFSSSVAKNYIVVEFAVYPAPGESADLDKLDFALNSGNDARVFPATAEEVAWRGQKQNAAPQSTGGIHVVTELGIEAGSRTNPSTGKAEHGIATYGGIGVDNRPSPPPAPAGSQDDIYAVEGRLRRMAFPAGQSSAPAAGYLYFPMPAKRPKNGVIGLEYSRNGERRELRLPLK